MSTWAGAKLLALVFKFVRWEKCYVVRKEEE